jgi:hypothetical protein
MATGVFRPADRYDVPISPRNPNLSGVNWAALGNLVNQAPKPTVPKPKAYVEPLGSAGRELGSFPAGQIGDAAKALQPVPDKPVDLSGVDWNQLGEYMDVMTPGWRNTGDSTGSSTGGSTGGIVDTIQPVPSAPAMPTADQITQNLLAEFDKIRAAEEAKITGAGQNLQTALASVDPMAQFRWNPMTATIPQATMANYLAATGTNPAQLQATQQLTQQLLDAALGDVGQFASGTETAAANWRQRQQDIGAQMTADAINQLALNAMAAKMGIQSGDAARRQAQINQMLELALEYGKLNRGGTVTAPQIPMSQITLPGGQVIQLPQTWF